ncbi:MAG: hypothetical protein NTY38_09855, partial [Acidobacteria bacterium]|nr:hypothetical protein [Acidobacteriota bacterium]
AHLVFDVDRDYVLVTAAKRKLNTAATGRYRRHGRLLRRFLLVCQILLLDAAKHAGYSPDIRLHPTVFYERPF